MPYHIFDINSFKQYTLLHTVDSYREAKTIVRELRSSKSTTEKGGTGTTYRMMFAADAELAQKLLSEKREERPMGEHD